MEMKPEILKDSTNKIFVKDWLDATESLCIKIENPSPIMDKQELDNVSCKKIKIE